MEDQISERELLARYSVGERQFSGLDVVSDGSNVLQQSCLDGIALINCFLMVSFRGASLRDAIVHSNAKTCDFTGTDITGADFRDSALCATTFKDAKLDGADFTGAVYHSYTMSAGEVPDW